MKAKVARLPFRIIDRFKFIIERQLVKGAGFQLLVVGLLIGLISLIGGLLVMPQGGDFDRPGTVSGYVVFMGTLVAILTRWLVAKREELERGLTPVTFRNHIVIFVVAEIQDMHKISVIERAYPGTVEVVADDVSISRLIAQNVLHPGLSEIYNELLTAGEGYLAGKRSGCI